MSFARQLIEGLPYLGQCDRVRKSAGGEAFWQQLMKERQPVDCEELAEVVDLSTFPLDDGETFEQWLADNQRADPDTGCYRSGPYYFIQTAGFEFIFGQPLAEANEVSPSFLERAAQKVRREMKIGPGEAGFCQEASERLRDRLIKQGFDAKVAEGKYASKFDHYWVKVGGYIVDPTADQFNKRGVPEQPSVVVGAEASLPAYQEQKLFGGSVEESSQVLPPHRQYPISMLPRGMKEQLFNEYSVFVDGEADEREFYRRRVPMGYITLDKLVISPIPDDQLKGYEEVLDVPIVIANGKLIDGQHRIALARKKGITKLRYIDVTGLTNTKEAGFISDLPEAVEGVPQVMYHLTSKADFKLNPKKRPANNSTLGGDWDPGIFLTNSPEKWVNGYGYWRPFVAEFDTSALRPEDLRLAPGQGVSGEILVKADAYPRLKLMRVVPLDAHARETYGEPGWTETFFDKDYRTDDKPPSERGALKGWKYQGTAKDEPVEWQKAYASRIKKFAKKSGRANGAYGGQSEAQAEIEAAVPAEDGWFTGSKVVDAQGNPLRVYHGTQESFTRFDPEKRGSSSSTLAAKKAFWFASNMEVAEYFSKGGSVRAYHLALKNPLITDHSQHTSTVLVGGKGHFLRNEAVQRARRMGRDGVIFKNTFEAYDRCDVYAVFSPDSIRTAEELGEAVKAFHGTDADFDQFDQTNDIGFHFGSAEIADGRLRQMGDEEGEYPEGSNIKPVVLDIKNPLRLPDLHTWDPDEVARALADQGIITPEEAEVELVDQDQVQAWLAAKGYDAIVYANETEGTGDSYIVFDPALIRSAFGEAFHHGTSKAFTDFEVGAPGMNSNTFGSWPVKRSALFFAEDPKTAELFAMQGNSKMPPTGRVIAVDLDVKNPLDMTTGDGLPFDSEWYTQHGLSERYYINSSEPWVWLDDESGGKEFVAALKASGYDGMKFIENTPRGPSTTWAVFDKSQVQPRSA